MRTRVESSRQSPGRRSWCCGLDLRLGCVRGYVDMRVVLGRTVLSRQAAVCCDACDVGVGMNEGRMEEERAWAEKWRTCT